MTYIRPKFRLCWPVDIHRVPRLTCVYIYNGGAEVLSRVTRSYRFNSVFHMASWSKASWSLRFFSDLMVFEIFLQMHGFMVGGLVVFEILF